MIQVQFGLGLRRAIVPRSLLISGSLRRISFPVHFERSVKEVLVSLPLRLLFRRVFIGGQRRLLPWPMRLAERVTLVLRPHTLAKNVPGWLVRSCSCVLFSASFGHFRFLFDFVLQRNVAKHLHHTW